MNWKPILILSAAVLLLAAAGIYWWEEVNLMSLFDFEFQSIQLVNLSSSNINANVTLKLVSKTNISFVISNVNIELFVNGVSLGQASNPNPQTIPAMAFNLISFNFNVNSQDIVQQLQTLIQSDPNTQFPIRTKGSCHINSGGIGMDVPFDETFDSSISCLISGLV